MFDLEVELLSEFGPVSSLFKQQILIDTFELCFTHTDDFAFLTTFDHVVCSTKNSPRPTRGSESHPKCHVTNCQCQSHSPILNSKVYLGSSKFILI